MATAATEIMINTRKMRYTGEALAALKQSHLEENLKAHDHCNDSVPHTKGDGFSNRPWLHSDMRSLPPKPAKHRHIGTYALTTDVAPWVKNALANYTPSEEVVDLVKPFAGDFHELLEKERKATFGWHDLDAIEITYQFTLEVGAALLLAADKTNNPANLALKLHASRAGGDSHFKSWGRLLTGLECDPPIIVQFPFYLLMCQSFTFEPNFLREDFVYASLTGIDWARGQNKFNDRLAAFEKLARSTVPTLDDISTGEDRCFWRIALGFLRSMNDCENSREFKSPQTAAIEHDLDHDVIIAARAMDTIGSAYMCRDGAAWLDNEGVDSLIGSGLANDVMDLHTDIFTGETRNLLRLLYAPNLSLQQTMQTTSTILSSMLGEVFRGHHRARMHNREDGRVSSTSPPYSFCRARHRRIFEALELYMAKYPKFWDWTWEIYEMAKAQMTETGLAEPLVCGLKRARTQGKLADSAPTKYFNLWYDMIEDGSSQLAKKSPLGVSADLADNVRALHSLWHGELREAQATLEPGWGRKFDERSDQLFFEAGEILATRGEVNEDTQKYAVAYGRLSMGLPYVAYHTMDAIIMAYGAEVPKA